MKNLIQLLSIVLLLAFLQACGTTENKEQAGEEKVVNLYSHRHYPVDAEIFAKFTEQTGIKVNVVNAAADELIQRLEAEGENTQADLFFTVDVSRMERAKTKGLLQPFNSSVITSNVDERYRDSENYWFGMSYRARIIAYSKDRVQQDALKDYEDLADPQWKGKVLIRSSDNAYNQSLMASYIYAKGQEDALSWAKGVVSNFAREPKGSDRDQVKAIAAGEGDIAVVNTYYIGLLINDENEENQKSGNAVGVIFPNQDNRGTHINISGLALTKYAPNKENAMKLLEYLSGEEAQTVLAQKNYEYPTNSKVEMSDLLKSWGEFKTESVDFNAMSKLNQEVIQVFDQAGWK